MKKRITFIIFTLFVSSSLLSAPCLILSAMKKENAPIIKQMSHVAAGEFNHVKFISGVIGRKKVIVARTGIGAINAGIVTALLISHFHPQSVIFSGVAGSLQPSIKFGDVVVGTKYLSANFGQYTHKGPEFTIKLNSGPIKDIPPPLIYQADPALLNLFYKVKKTLYHSIIFGMIATDQHFPNNKAVDNLLSQNNVKAVAMEDYGVAHACWLYDTPMISVRAISDNIMLNTQYTVTRATQAAKRAADVVDAAVKQLS